MFKKVFESIQNLFGFKSRNQAEFDDAMLSILKAIADGRLYLTTREPGSLDTNKGKELAHAWSEAAVKVNRLNNELRDHCLALAKAFSDVKTQDTEHAGAVLDQIETIFTKASVFLGEGGKRPALATKRTASERLP